MESAMYVLASVFLLMSTALFIVWHCRNAILARLFPTEDVEIGAEFMLPLDFYSSTGSIAAPAHVISQLPAFRFRGRRHGTQHRADRSADSPITSSHLNSSLDSTGSSCSSSSSSPHSSCHSSSGRDTPATNSAGSNCSTGSTASGTPATSSAITTLDQQPPPLAAAAAAAAAGTASPAAVRPVLPGAAATAATHCRRLHYCSTAVHPTTRPATDQPADDALTTDSPQCHAPQAAAASPAAAGQGFGTPQGLGPPTDPAQAPSAGQGFGTCQGSGPAADSAQAPSAEHTPTRPQLEPTHSTQPLAGGRSASSDAGVQQAALSDVTSSTLTDWRDRPQQLDCKAHKQQQQQDVQQTLPHGAQAMQPQESGQQPQQQSTAPGLQQHTQQAGALHQGTNPLVCSTCCHQKQHDELQQQRPQDEPQQLGREEHQQQALHHTSKAHLSPSSTREQQLHTSEPHSPDGSSSSSSSHGCCHNAADADTCSHSQAASSGSSSTVGAQDGELSCVICFAEYVEGELIKELPCKHLYHAACIDKWLRRSVNCPLCKQPVWQPTNPTFIPC